VSDIDDKRLDRQFDKLEQQLPRPVGRALRWLRDPAMIWIRIPVALLLISGGIFSFLPILGLWMLPLGVLLLAQDIPFLKRPTGRALIWAERRWVEWRRKRRSSSGTGSDTESNTGPGTDAP
jgi:hypothetical protein